MDYFVSIEDSVYCHWQTELLIESFKALELDDSLVVAIAKTDFEHVVNISNNITKHKRVFVHENFGRSRGCPPLNRPFAIHVALEQGLLHKPFVVIEPDMILLQPVVEDGCDISFQIDPGFTRESVDAHLPLSRMLLDTDAWLPLGSVFLIQNVADDFFQLVIGRTEALELQSREEGMAGWWYSEKVGWVLAMLERSSGLTYRGVAAFESNLLQTDVAHNFLHYRHGLPPYFSKHMYHFDSDGFAMGDPFVDLLETNPTAAANLMQNIVRRYISTYGTIYQQEI